MDLQFIICTESMDNVYFIVNIHIIYIPIQYIYNRSVSIVYTSAMSEMAEVYIYVSFPISNSFSTIVFGY